MLSNGTKRQHEEDWDVLDLTGPTPVYSKSAVTPSASRPRIKSQTESKTAATSTTSSAAPKAKHLHGDSYPSTYVSSYDSSSPTMSSSHHQPGYGSMYKDPATSSYIPAAHTYSYTSYPYHGSSMHPYPSSVPEALPPPAKKSRKGMRKSVDNTPVAEKPEKRGAMTKKKCPKNILDRVERVMSQRFFMIDRRRDDGEFREEFSVLGSTGNVYTVIIGKTPSCSCPDATKGNHCKHILFIFLKVLQVSQDSHVWYQKALLTSELAAIFADAPPAPNSFAHQRVRDAYARSTGQTLNVAATPSGSGSGGASGSASGVTKGPRRQPTAEDDCPICYEGMHGAAESRLEWCEACGNAVHKECFSEWAKSSRNNHTCVFCRAPWVNPAPDRKGGNADRGAGASEGYLNLGALAGLSGERDTSTYHHGPRSGTRYYGY
ncbi:hypothetical protein PAXRUDRAFT_831831 [Paxillus rubicundulus Ve08.2h10]|uniref:Anaphase-promoting complex subunit 11 n=1 Tax=Paxillus rubicundulus Ve08.2h10 TaxID=930991 RepID=A0A0D0CVH8_9AGAM|nr:hypothetical protein PAXRUDRAFT_831831 [Paxillus rubicundulus Ve08.2h10]